MTAYYNEFDPYAAEWLKNLIAAGHIAPGIVDSRSIEDVRPDDLFEFTQCHFFAGIGVWSYALRLAGWPDDRPVWTGSCPCQPFSAAGKGDGFDDERHLWPAWFHLIEQRRPPVVFGEQVEAAIKHGWLDLVQSDLEGIGYAFGAAGIPAAGVGAPHIRQRLFFVADANNKGLEGRGGMPERAAQCLARAGVLAGGLGNTPDESCEWNPGGIPREETSEYGARGAVDGRLPVGPEHAGTGLGERPGPTNGHWRDADWLGCRDGKWRPVEPGTFPLAHGAPSRVGRLRAYGNAIVPQAAAEMIKAYMECRP